MEELPSSDIRLVVGTTRLSLAGWSPSVRSLMSSVPFTVALDGPSDTGKSTLAAGLRASLDLEVLVIPCYADLAGCDLPPARGEDVAEQLRGLEFYLELDRARREMAVSAAPGSVVITDRSHIGLLAHTYAIDRTGGPPAYAQARVLIDRVRESLLVPDLILYLALDATGRAARREASDRDAWFSSERLNEQIDAFFQVEAPALLPGRLVSIDAGPGAKEVRESAQKVILRSQAERR